MKTFREERGFVLLFTDSTISVLELIFAMIPSP